MLLSPGSGEVGVGEGAEKGATVERKTNCERDHKGATVVREKRIVRERDNKITESGWLCSMTWFRQGLFPMIIRDNTLKAKQLGTCKKQKAAWYQYKPWH